MTQDITMKAIITKWILFLCKIGCSMTKDIFVMENGTVNLVCNHCYTYKEIVWKGPRDYQTYAINLTINTNLEKSSRLKIRTNTSFCQHVLQISNFSTEDEGSYKCTVSVNYSTIKEEHFFKVRIGNVPVVSVGPHNITVAEKTNLTLHCKYTPNNNITGIAWIYTGFRNYYKEKVLSNESSLILNDVTRNQSGKYQCIVHNLAGLGMDAVFLSVEYVPSVAITYRNSSSGRWLLCSPNDIPSNYTFYPWEHLSSFHEHIRYIDGNESGTLILHNTLGESNRHCDAGIYVCRVSIGVPINNYIVSEIYFLNTTGKPYFVSSNKDVQTGLIGHRTQLITYVVSQPMIKSVTVQTKNAVPIQTNYTAEEDIKTYDIVYGKKITVLATKLSVIIKLPESDRSQEYSVIVTNYYGSSSFEITVNPETNETSTSSSNRTQMMMIIIIVVLAILLLFGAFKVMNCHRILCCRKDLSPGNDAREERHSYDEINNLHLSTDEINIRPQVTDHEDIEMPTVNNTSYVTNVAINNDILEFVSDLCFSEVEDIFRTRLSTLSANTSDSSYLSPSAPYTELTQIHRRPHSFHEYEQITNCDQTTKKVSENLVHRERRVKRSTI